MNIFDNKNILISGVTGFVGKVLLEKILFSFPQVNKIYVLVRQKAQETAEQRFQKNVLQSQCFRRLEVKYAGQKRGPRDLQAFHQFISQKVKVLNGDLTLEGLGLKPNEYNELTANLHFIYQVAASVDFNQRLDQALQVNVFGPLRVLDMAKQCKQLQCFVQVSTCYVNSDKQGWIQEKIYPFPYNPQQIISLIQGINPNEIEAKTPNILKEFPNTYTFTKSLCENILSQDRQHVNVVILRPSIIGAS